MTRMSNRLLDADDCLMLMMCLSCRTSNVELSGDIGSVSISASGTGTTNVAGVTDSATVSVSGAGIVNLQIANGSALCLPGSSIIPHSF